MKNKMTSSCARKRANCHATNVSLHRTMMTRTMHIASARRMRYASCHRSCTALFQYIHIYTRVYIRMYTCARAHTHTRTRAHVHVYTHTDAHTYRLNLNTMAEQGSVDVFMMYAQAHTHARTHAHTHTHWTSALTIRLYGAKIVCMNACAQAYIRA
jgi:hypothetical protein